MMSATKHISRLSSSFNHKTKVSVLRPPPQVITPSIQCQTPVSHSSRPLIAQRR